VESCSKSELKANGRKFSVAREFILSFIISRPGVPISTLAPRKFKGLHPRWSEDAAPFPFFWPILHLVVPEEKPVITPIFQALAQAWAPASREKKEAFSLLLFQI